MRLVAETDVAPVVAVASEERLRQAIDNLIENAVEVSPAHGAVTLAQASSHRGSRFECAMKGPA